jgi:hypothetical protein
MPEEKRKVNSWVPVSLWERVEKLGYDSPTRAVCDGLELLVSGHNPDTNGHKLDTNGHVPGHTSDTVGHIPGHTLDASGYVPDIEIQAMKAEIEKLKVELLKAPDPLELTQLRTKSDELQSHNQTLKKELENANTREQDFKSMHNNYMLQMQTLINQKAIEAPGAKKSWWRFW